MSIASAEISLNSEQRRVVNAPDGCTMVVAGPGTGKTRVLVERAIAYLEKTESEDIFKQVLVVTFTRRAVGELRARLRTRLDSQSFERVTVRTLHGIGLYWLRHHNAHLEGRRERFGIHNEQQTKRLLRETLDTVQKANDCCIPTLASAYPQIRSRSSLSKFVVRYLIQTKDTRYLDPVQPVSSIELTNQQLEAIQTQDPKEAAAIVLEHILGCYEAKLRSLNVCDFSDLIGIPVRAMHSDPRLRARTAGMYGLVLVDEYQDLSPSQFDLVNLLASECRNITVVGDPDQAIYEWRGAKPQIFHEFREYWSRQGMTIDEYELVRNHRSVPMIVDGFSTLAQWSDNGNERGFYSIRQNTPDVPHVDIQILRLNLSGYGYARSHSYPPDERRRCAELVARWVREEGVSPGEIMVLGRARYVYGGSDSLSALLTKYQVPHRMLRGRGFFESKVVRIVLAWLEFLYQPADRSDVIHLSEMIKPWSGLGDSFARQLHDILAQERVQGIEDAVEAVIHGKFRRCNTEAVERFKRALGDLVGHDHDTGEGALRAILRLLAASGMQEFRSSDTRVHLDAVLDLDSIESDDDDDDDDDPEDLSQARSHLEALGEIARQYASLEDLMTHLDLLQFDADDEDDKDEAVRIGTVHSAKGLEASRVIVLGMTSPKWPQEFLTSVHTEDQRVAYVACSRAKDRLVLFSTVTRDKELSPSPYLCKVQDAIGAKKS